MQRTLLLLVFSAHFQHKQQFKAALQLNVCIYLTLPAGSSQSPAAAWLPLLLVLLFPEGAPVIAVSPCVLLPPWTHGTHRLFKTRTPHLPTQRLLKSTLTLARQTFTSDK